MAVVPVPHANGNPLRPGEVLIERGRFYTACAGNTWLEFLEVQLEGKKRLATQELLRGMAIANGTQLGLPTA
jgi:methionyl-tRNA formyltransferase